MYEWFEAIAGPNYAPALMWTLLALLGLFVILLAVRLIRRFRSGTYIEGGRNRRARLAIIDATAVDDMRRLVLVRRDDVEHLILIGGPSDVVVEQNIHRQGHPVQQTASRAQPQRAPDAPAPVRPEPSQDVAAMRQTRPQVPPVATPPLQDTRNAKPPRPAGDNAPSGPAPAPSPQRQEPVMAPVAATTAAGAASVENQAAATSADAAPLSVAEANEPANQSVDLDDALLSELETSLEPAEAPANEARQRKDTSEEISLDEEMARLLGDLSDDNRR